MHYKTTAVCTLPCYLETSRFSTRTEGFSYFLTTSK